MISKSTEICVTAAQLASWSLLLFLGDIHAVLSRPYLVAIGAAGLALVLASSLQMMVQLVSSSKKGLDPHKVVVRQGIYGYVRHPIFTGILVMSLTVLMTSPTLPVGLAFLLIALITNVRAALEEVVLEERTPEYREYRSRTKRFIPFVL
jgi:protein-S-isoprenylcysteine O-methyltransferase Ste14